MAQALAKGGVISQNKADWVDRQKENRRKRIHAMNTKIGYLERDIPKFEMEYLQAMSKGLLPAQLLPLAKKVDDAKAELNQLKSEVVKLSAEK